MFSGNYDVICITETWLIHGITDGRIDPLAYYRIIRCNRGSRGGGVCVLVSKRLDAVEVPLVNYFPTLELICIDIYDGDNRIRLFSVYRRPCYDDASIDYVKQLVDCFEKKMHR